MACRLFGLLWVVVLFVFPCFAQSDASRVGALSDELSKTIDVQFVEMPLRRAIEAIQQKSGATFVVERQYLGDRLEDSVSLSAEQMSVTEVLDLVLRQVGGDWQVAGEVVIVSSRVELLMRSKTIKIYDIRPLLIALPNFRGRSFDLNQALSNTNSGGSDARMSDVSRGGGGGLFGDDDEMGDVEEGNASRAEKIEMIVSLIRDSIGGQEDWANHGGDLASVRELSGSLIVNAPPSYHAAIRTLLDSLTTDAGRVVFIEARFIELPTAGLDGLLGDGQPNLILKADDAAEKLAVLAGDDSARQLGVLRTVCFNGQRIYITAGRQTLFLSDAEPIPDAAGMDPTVSAASSGTVIDVEPTIDLGGDNIIVTLRGDVVTGLNLRASRMIFGEPGGLPRVSLSGGFSGDAEIPADEKKKETTTAELDGSAHVGGNIHPPDPASISIVDLEMLEQEGVEYRASIRIPNGGAVILSGASNMIESVRKDSEVVLLLRVRSGGE